MKKVLCTILILLMLPITTLCLVACSKDGKDISKFYTAYTNIANNTQNLTLVEATDNYNININSNKIDINYTLSPALSALVEDNTSQYRHLKYFYQQLLDDTLAPLYFFGPKIASSKKINEKQTDKLYSKLHNLQNNYENLDYYVGILTTSLKADNNTNLNLSHLKSVFSQYEQVINSASELSALICDIYFNTILTNSNLNYSSKTFGQLNDTDLNSITINVRSRLYYYKSIYANVYNQLYIKGANLPQKLISATGATPEYEPYNYISSVNSLTNQSIETLRNNKEDIYNNMISLYNIQNNITVAYNNFITATNKVVYIEVTPASSVEEQNYRNVILQFANGIAVDSYEILNNLIDLLYF